MSPSGARPPQGLGLGKNSKPKGEATLEELKKTAKSRGISLEKLLAQMVQQYLKESKTPPGPGGA